MSVRGQVRWLVKLFKEGGVKLLIALSLLTLLAALACASPAPEATPDRIAATDSVPLLPTPTPAPTETPNAPPTMDPDSTPTTTATFNPPPTAIPTPLPTPTWPGRRIITDGTWTVFGDIAPGTYVAQGGDYCQWARLSGFDYKEDTLIAHGGGDPRPIVTVDPTDKGFYSSHCRVWFQVDDFASPSTTILNGTWLVHIEVIPGTYTAPGSDRCYWERLSSFGGTFEERIAIGSGELSPTVTIEPTDAGFLTNNCGEWTPVHIPKSDTYTSCEAADAAGEERVESMGDEGKTLGFSVSMVPGYAHLDWDGDGVVCEQYPTPVPVLDPPVRTPYTSCDAALAAGEERINFPGTNWPVSGNITVTRGFPYFVVTDDVPNEGGGLLVCEVQEHLHVDGVEPDPPSFYGDGTWTADPHFPFEDEPGEIFVGTYGTTSADDSCYWETRDQLGEIVATGGYIGRHLVTIGLNISTFHTSGCGEWTHFLYSDLLDWSPIIPAEGTWHVPRNIYPWSYTAPGGEFCQWQRLSGFTGTPEDVITGEIGVTNPVVTIVATDAGFKASGCGEWTPVE